jgi:hypothetical protein
LTFAALLVAAAAALGGCGSMIGSLPVVGEPKETPKAPEVTPAYPHIGEVPTEPATKTLTPAERAKAEADLAAARTQSVIDRRKQINGPDAR